MLEEIPDVKSALESAKTHVCMNSGGGLVSPGGVTRSY